MPTPEWPVNSFDCSSYNRNSAFHLLSHSLLRSKPVRLRITDVDFGVKDNLELSMKGSPPAEGRIAEKYTERDLMIKPLIL